MDVELRSLERSAAAGDHRAATDLVRRRRRHGLPGYTLETFPPNFLASVHGGRPGALIRYPPGVMARRHPDGRWVAEGDSYVRRRFCGCKRHVTDVEIDVVMWDTSPLGGGDEHGPLCARGRRTCQWDNQDPWWELPPARNKHCPECLEDCLADGILYAVLVQLDDGTTVEWGGVHPHGTGKKSNRNNLNRFVRRQRWFRLSPANPEIVWRTD